MKFLLVAILALGSVAHAAGQESFSVDGKTFATKAQVIRYIVDNHKVGVTVSHTRCEILTNKLTLKACPKNSGAFENQPYQPKFDTQAAQ